MDERLHRLQLARARLDYGPRHKRLRREWARKVERGGVLCARCGLLIAPDGDPWDLGHSDYDRTVYNGPSIAVAPVQPRTETSPAGSGGTPPRARAPPGSQ